MKRVKSKRRYSETKKSLAALAIFGLIMAYGFRDDLQEMYTNFKVQRELSLAKTESTEVTEPEIVVEVIDEEPEIIEEEEIEEVIEEPIIFPEYASSELLDSGYEFLEEDFKALVDINPDVVGWVVVDGTNINYPVLQYSEDNDYYLHHDIYNTDSRNGSVLMDYRTDMSLGDDSTTMQNSPLVLYAHNMKSGAMFGTLKRFKNAGFVDEHPFGVFYGIDGSVYKLEFFGDSYISGASDEGLYSYYLDNEDEFNKYIDGVFERSTFNDSENIIKREDILYGDKIVPLVTCTYEDMDINDPVYGLRYVVYARAVKQYTNYEQMEAEQEQIRQAKVH